jgi:hypothetical protein
MKYLWRWLCFHIAHPIAVRYAYQDEPRMMVLVGGDLRWWRLRIPLPLRVVRWWVLR